MKLKNIQWKPRKHRGQIFNRTTDGVWNAEIETNDSIRIHGTFTNHVNGPQVFDKTFKIGFQCECDSYNLSFLGPIVAIGPNSVSVSADSIGGGIKRLELADFIDRNWNFDLAKVEKENAEEMMCL